MNVIVFNYYIYYYKAKFEFISLYNIEELIEVRKTEALEEDEDKVRYIVIERVLIDYYSNKELKVFNKF